jgi:hypothetical protein
MGSEFIYILIIGILVMAGVYYINPPLTHESFRNLDLYPTSQLCKVPLTTPTYHLTGPADASIQDPRKPYHLLGDYLEPAQERLANLKSECAYIADGQRRIEKIGSYGQITNNYKKEKPDNGSTLLRELSLSFYR